MQRRSPWPLLAAATLVAAGALMWWPRPAAEPDSPEEHEESGPGPDVPLGRRQAEAPAPDPPPAPSGEAVRISLSEPPAPWFLRGETTGNERHYRRIVAELAGEDVYVSADLGRAAREFVFQYTELGREPPSDVRTFLIRASGALAGDTAFQHVRTSSDTDKALRTAIGALLKEPPDGDGRLVVGVGEVFTPGRKTRRHIGVVATRLPILIEPLPRRVEPGATWRIRGRLLAPFRGIRALVTWPDGRSDTVPIRREQSRLDVRVPVGETRGDVAVQLVGEGPRGPGKLVQLEVRVGLPLAQHKDIRLPPAEDTIDDATSAAALAFKLLNADRARHRLPALRWDAGLARVAEDHSRDMRDNNFFSHRSPTTGLHSARLARAGYRAGVSAENLALNVSIHEAEAGLMHSLGHRRNILNERVTHVGIGVVGEEKESGQKRWWVTQLFAKPVAALDVPAARKRVLDAIAEAREGKTPLREDPALETVAEEAADQAVARRGQGASLDGVTSGALSSARSRGLLRGRLRAWAAVTPDLDALSLPGVVRDARARRIGVGLAQSAGPHGEVAVVLLVGE